MIESALRTIKPPSSSTSSSTSNSPAPTPPETCLALQSFFRHEYPLGGSVENRFIRFFPLLCDRIFGPILLLHQQHLLNTNKSSSSTDLNSKSTGGGGSSSRSSGTYSLSNEEIEALQNAWLNQRYKWNIPSSSTTRSTSSSSSSRSSKLSPSSRSSSSLSGSRSGSNSSNVSGPRISTTGNTTGTSAASANVNSLANDPFVQLLSPSSILSCVMKDTYQQYHQQQQQQHQQIMQQPIQVLLNTFFFHILESSYVIPGAMSNINHNSGSPAGTIPTSSSSKQIKNLRISFPFLELSKNMQCSYIHEIILHEQQKHENQQQGSTSSGVNNASQIAFIDECEKTSSDVLIQKMHYSPLVQNELIQQLSRSHHHHGHDKSQMTNPRSSGMKSILSPASSPTFHITTRISDSSLSSLQLPPSQQHHQQQSQHFTFDSSKTHGQENNVRNATRTMITTNLSLFQNIKIIIDAWEYFMISFFRHAIYSGGKLKHTIVNNQSFQSSSPTNTSGYYPSSSRSSSSIIYGEKMYYFLFKTYCEYYIPHIFDKSLHNEFQTQYAMEDPETKEYLRIYPFRSESWIRLMMEFYMNYDHVYTKTQDGFDHLSPTLKRELMTQQNVVENNSSGGGGGNNIKRLGLLACSYDLATLLPIPAIDGSGKNIGMGGRQAMKVQMYTAPSKQVQRCVRFFIDHLIRDPTIRQNCQSKSSISQLSANDNNDGNVQWPLSKEQTMVQTSFYNYVRTLLRHGPVHVKNSSFYTAIELWLNWLEPWNVVQRKKSGSSIANARELFHNVSDRVTSRDSSKRSIYQYYTTYEKPKLTSTSKYTPAWESYVAANLHLYVVPLAIFLRRSREFDFSAQGFQLSIGYVQKVLRVFSPQLVKTLEKLMNHNNYVSENELSSNKRLYAIVQRHEQNLGEYCPPRPNTMIGGVGTSVWSLEMLQDDMHALLEEIVLQHRETVCDQDIFERFFSNIQGLILKEGVHAEESIIKKVVQKAKVIVNFPRHYEVFPNGGIGNDYGDDRKNLLAQYHENSIFSPEREQQSGFITTKGRYQILEGSKICNAMDVAFVGDPMYSRVKDYEIAIFVKFTIYLSEKLNERCGFVQKSSAHLHGDEDEDLKTLVKEQNEAKALKFRFNLRPMADTRNWIFIAVGFRMLWKTIS